MLVDVLSWGLQPSWVTGDAWYSSLENLKFIRGQKLNFMFGIENNRVVSIERGTYIQIQTFEGWSTDNIETVYLKDYGMVRVCRQLYKNAYRYYIMNTAELNNLEKVTAVDFNRVILLHFNRHIERKQK